jgi:hypothetical protein
MAPVGGHLTAAGGILPGHPVRPQDDLGAQDRTPQAADGQSADGSGSLQLPLRFLKAGPAGGRLRRPSSRRQRHDGHRGAGLPLGTRLAMADKCNGWLMQQYDDQGRARLSATT